MDMELELESVELEEPDISISDMSMLELESPCRSRKGIARTLRDNTREKNNLIEFKHLIRVFAEFLSGLLRLRWSGDRTSWFVNRDLK